MRYEAEKARLRGLLKEIGDAVTANDAKIYRQKLSSLEDFAKAANDDHLIILRARDYDKIIENDKDEFVRALYETVIGLPLEEHFDKAGVHNTKGPLKHKVAMALLDSPDLLAMARNKEKGPVILRVVTDLVKHESPDSTAVVRHFLETSCKKHHIKVAPLAAKIFEDLYRNENVMAGASDVLVANLALLSPHVASEKLEGALNAIVEKSKAGQNPALQEHRLLTIIEELTAEPIAKALAKLGDNTPDIKNILLGKQARLTKIAKLRSNDAGNAELQFQKLPLEKQVDSLKQAIKDGNAEAFGEQLLMLLHDPKNKLNSEITGFLVAPVVDEVIKKDMGDFLQQCVDLNMDVVSPQRLALAGLTGELPLKPAVAKIMLATPAARKMAADGDRILPDILEKLAAERAGAAPELLKTVLHMVGQSDNKSAVSESAYAFLSKAVQDQASLFYDSQSEAKINGLIEYLNAEQSVGLLKGLLSLSPREWGAGDGQKTHDQRSAALVGMLVAKMPEGEVRKLMPFIIANASLEALQQIEDQSQVILPPVDVLHNCCNLLSAGSPAYKDELTLRTLNDVLDRGSFTDNQIYDVMMGAIANAKPQHMEALLTYAGEHGMDIVNRFNKDGRTPLTTALGIKKEPARAQMANFLVGHGADGRNDLKGNNPLGMMGDPKIGAQAAAARAFLEETQKKQIGIAFIPREEVARAKAKALALEVIMQAHRELQTLGYTPDEIAAATQMMSGGPGSHIGEANPPPKRLLGGNDVGTGVPG